MRDIEFLGTGIFEEITKFNPGCTNRGSVSQRLSLQEHNGYDECLIVLHVYILVGTIVLSQDASMLACLFFKLKHGVIHELLRISSKVSKVKLAQCLDG